MLIRTQRERIIHLSTDFGHVKVKILLSAPIIFILSSLAQKTKARIKNDGPIEIMAQMVTVWHESTGGEMWSAFK